MFHIILYQPEIPPNTGNIIRLCANTGATLHLIHPLGFEFDDKRLRRAGLDYHEWANVQHYQNLDECIDKNAFNRIFALSSKGKTCYSKVSFQANDAFLFGPETTGLPKDMIHHFGINALYLPQVTRARSLNLCNCVSIMLYEAWRQVDFQTSSSPCQDT